MTHPAQTIAAVISAVAIVGVIGALRLTPDAGTDKLVDNGSAAFEQTKDFRERFGDDAIVVLARGDLQKLVLTKRLGDLLRLEACLAGNAPPGDPEFPTVCQRIAGLDATRVVFGPATFLRQSADRAGEFIQETISNTQQQSAAAGQAAARQAKKQGLSEAKQAAAAVRAAQQAVQAAVAQFTELASQVGEFGSPSIDNPEFVSAIVFDSRQEAGTPKSRFGYLFPSEEGALISIRLRPGLDDDTRREAIGLIREATESGAFRIKDTSYEISGVPVLVEGLADELGSELILLLGFAMVVMALTLIAVFGPPLRLLPLFVALAASAMAFGILSIVGGSLTMASVAVLPVVIGLGVDYAIQLQARFREATARGERPAPAAVIAAVNGGTVIATAALATAVGFAVLLLSPIPMVREFALALVVGIISALSIALTAGLAALSMTSSDQRPPLRERIGLGGRLSPPRHSTADGVVRVRGLLSGARASAASFGGRALALSISRPGRVLAIAVVIAAAGWAVGTQTKVNSDIRELVPGDLPALQSVDELEEVTGISGELDVVVRGEDVTTPEAISWMRGFKSRVLEQHGFGGEFPDCRAPGTELCPGPALSDLIGGDGEPTQERIDAVLAAVPDYFLDAILSRSGDGDEIANVSLLVPVMPLDEQERLIEEIRAELDPPPGISAEVAGLLVLVADANSELSGSRYWLALLSLIAVAGVLLAVYRSPARAWTPLVPIVLATGWSALVVEAMQIPLNPMSATLGVLVIAVSTEFSVLLSARHHEERARGLSVGEALRRTYSSTGTAVLASGITSIAGFGVLVLSGISMLRDFGLVTLVDLTAALLGVMVVLPAALVWGEGGYRPLPSIRERLRRRTSAVPTEPAA